ncbi:26S proteasome complex subunit SEM1-like [Symsagittifera roscoffensis]|uniref:26S proteasome complex subunit SEM1-like n=1 Tax=Symsagittifera roscoffensis TaxID=84072 RepID=UPI00307BB3A9
MANPTDSAASCEQNKAGTDASAAAQGESGENKQRMEGKVDLALLNEDDDFEEFPAEEWDDVDPTTQTTKVWEDDWDDDMIEDDFSIELRAELEKRGFTPKPKATPMESN